MRASNKIQKSTVIAMIIILAVLIVSSGCGCKHQYTAETIKEATCAEEGKILYTCSLCGSNYIENTDKTDDHNYKSKKTKEANCIEEGEIKYTCTVCGHEYIESIPKNDKHDYSSSVTKEPTVFATGTRTYTCKLCGHIYTDVIEKLNSDWKIDYTVDEFGDKTNNTFVYGTFHGTFSNSATTGSQLTVNVIMYPYDEEVIMFRLLEYNTHVATFLSSETITLKIKDSKGKTKSYELIYVEGVVGTLDKELVKTIKNNEEVSIVISTSSKYQTVSDTYSFKLNNAGLEDVIKEAKKR